MATTSSEDKALIIGISKKNPDKLSTGAIYFIDSLEKIVPSLLFDVNKHSKYVYSAVCHNSNLYASIDNEVVNLTKNEVVGRKRATTLCSHNKKLYGAFKYGQEIFDVENAKIIAERKYNNRDNNWIHDLESHNGKLYDASGNKISDVFSGELLKESGTTPWMGNGDITISYGTNITDLCLHEGKLFYSMNDVSNTNSEIHNLSDKDVIFARISTANPNHYSPLDYLSFQHLTSFSGKLLAISNNCIYEIDTKEKTIGTPRDTKLIFDFNEFFAKCSDFIEFSIEELTSVPKSVLNSKLK